MTTLHAAAATDTGKVRPTNQDMALVADELVAVADGMGGHAAGEVAAQTAISALHEAFSTNPTFAGLVDAAVKANTVVFDKGEHDKELRGMGTTLTAAAIVPGKGGDRVGVVNIGDSRAYVLEEGHIRQLTEDHSLVEEMVRQGDLSPTEAAVHPHRHILTRALGIDSDVEVDSWELPPKEGMRILLCSDGLTNECTDDEIAAILLDNSDAQAAAQSLVARALDHGGNDNITVVVANVDLDERAAAGSATTEEGDERALEGSEKAFESTREPTRRPNAAVVTTAVMSVVRPLKGLAGLRASTSERWRHARMARTSKARPATAYIPNGPLVTPRVVIFVTALVLVILGAFGFIFWFDKATYFVGVDGNNVAIYNGRPGGLLWFHPTLVEDTPIDIKKVYPSSLTMLRTGMLASSYAGARHVVNNLANEGNPIGTSP